MISGYIGRNFDELFFSYYDQQLRDLLFQRWTAFVEQAEIKHRSDLARVEYLSSVDERLDWSKNGLPVDELCAENAIMLHRLLCYVVIKIARCLCSWNL